MSASKKEEKQPEIDFNRLKDPFSEKDIDWRISRFGKKEDGSLWATAVPFITSRAIHDRLDKVCGSEKWQLRYSEHLGETICEIGIKIGTEWIWKAGGSERTHFEAFKGGLSGSEKRAGVPWGIGRYLYRLKEINVVMAPKKPKSLKGWKFQPRNKRNKFPEFYWKIPPVPDGYSEEVEPENPVLINVSQYRELIKIVREKGYNIKRTLNRLSEKIFCIQKITDLPLSKYEIAKKMLMGLEVKK